MKLIDRLRSSWHVLRSDRIARKWTLWISAAFVLFILLLLIMPGKKPDVIYSAYSSAPNAIRPKAVLGYNTFVHGGIEENYLEVYLPSEKRTFLRLQHPTYSGQAVLEFTRNQTLELLDYLEQYISQLPDDRMEKQKDHMLGTYHPPQPAKNGRSLAITVDYTTERLKYRLFFGENSKSPVLDIAQLRELRDFIQSEIENR